ncbi:hypothetical protein H4R33_006792 [Dimargaris cristalligena]|uniref:Rhodanese-like domain-containing protein n=1 Tax=Dimargaris cristalligena TaxID=215637 RepID=A0A4P9ZJQ1_9FUNG|nr:hypothetical protein H4R33_006792 [Dimargaris cristalligena]RKP33444.1 Rhodanese-like domain-containing protein [Dimargaris cristalligena]|eukprot:RKP33444.1 Rhodanese-like domain-containing protein [Dimargaris cristalligena]
MSVGLVRGSQVRVSLNRLRSRGSAAFFSPPGLLPPTRTLGLLHHVRLPFASAWSTPLGLPFPQGRLANFRGLTTETPSSSPSVENPYQTYSFYTFVNLPPERVVHLQRQIRRHLHEELRVKGRIYLATEGINGQVACPVSNVDQLRSYLLGYPEFQTLVLNEATEHSESFLKLIVTIRNQLVRDEVPPSQCDIAQQPEYLSPAEWHAELAEADPERLTLLDMRNNYESAIGHFKHATLPDAATFAAEVPMMRDLVRGKEKEPVYMYCTGGIRCSKAGAILKSEGFQNVRMLRGGITAYGRYIRETGLPSLYLGRNFTFDERLGEPISPDVLGECYQCSTPHEHYTNCVGKACNTLFIQCPTCAQTYHNTCGDTRCLDYVQNPPDPTNREPTRWNHIERVDPTVVKIRIQNNIRQ